MLNGRVSRQGIAWREPARALARDDPRGAFRCPRNSKKSGQSGSDVPTPREALYLCMRERGNGTDGLE